MDENLTRGYSQLQSASSKRLEIVTSSSSDTPQGRSCFHSRTLPPLDNYRFIYISLVVCGAGFLLPYNTFIVAVDYFHFRFPAIVTTIIDVNVTYVCLAFASVLIVNNLLTDTIDMRKLVIVGYVTSALTLALFAFVDVWFGLLKMADAYNLSLVSIAVFAVGCTVQQHSFYGYTRVLPRRYTQAVMIGESTAGLLASMLRIVTKLAVDDIRLNTFFFLFIMVIILVICSAAFLLTVQTEFVQFYVQLCIAAQKDDNDCAYEGDEVQHTCDQQRNIYGVVVIQSPTDIPNPVPATTTTVATVTTTTNDKTTTTVTIALSAQAQTGHSSDPLETELNARNRQRLANKADSDDGRHSTCRKKMTQKLIEVVKKDAMVWCFVCRSVWPYMLCVWLTYAVTLSLFPGIMTQVVSCRMTNWTQIVLLTSFNLFDCIGKALTSRFYGWSVGWLVLCSLLRMSLIPAAMMAVSSSAGPSLTVEIWSAALAAIIGLTNGYLGNISMITAPSRVPNTKRPLAGKVMTHSYTLGLLTGSAFAYLLNSFIVAPSDQFNQFDFRIPSVNASLPIFSSYLVNSNTTESL